MRLLLDTCTFLWAIATPALLSHRARDAFQRPENGVFLSSASAMEIAIKVGLGRLHLPDRLEDFVPEARHAHHIDDLPLDEASALALVRLPPIHRDPFDRALVAQAITHGLAVLTPDPQIAQYPVRTIW